MSYALKTANYFRNKLHLRCKTGFLIHLCTMLTSSAIRACGTEYSRMDQAKFEEESY